MMVEFGWIKMSFFLILVRQIAGTDTYSTYKINKNIAKLYFSNAANLTQTAKSAVYFQHSDFSGLLYG